MEISTNSTLQFNNETEEVHYKDCDLFLLKNVFVNNDSVRNLAKEVTNLQFKYHTNDLHSVSQHEIEVNISQFYMKQFMYLLDTNVRKFVEDRFNVKTNIITLTASEYKKGDFLLCHDDRYGDRTIAFVYYLSERWTKHDGGALRFFNHDKNTKEPLNDDYKQVILPVFNSLVLFRVSKTSHHEVQQVFTNKSRLSLNGWFHFEEQVKNEPEDPSVFMTAPLMQFDEYHDVDATEILCNPLRLSIKGNMDHFAKRLSSQMSILLGDFLHKNFYTSCANELQGDNSWMMKGPANHRKYEVLQVEKEDDQIMLPDNLPHVKRLIGFLVSERWLTYLCKLTSLGFAVLSDDKVPPLCIVEVQRWKEGSYTLLSDKDFKAKYPNVEVTVYFEVDLDPIEDSFEDKLGQQVQISGSVMKQINRKFTSSYYRRLADVKFSRHMANQLLEASKKKDKTKSVRLGVRSAKRCVKNKMIRIKDYREKYGGLADVLYEPANNNALISINSEESTTCTAYIRQRTLCANPKTCFYCVNVIYVTTSQPDQ